MSVHAESTAAAARLEQPTAPASLRARYVGLSIARTLTRNTELGEAKWAELRPRLDRLPDPAIIEVPRIRKEDLTPAVMLEAARCPTPVVFEGLIDDCEAVKTWSPAFFRDNYGDVLVPVAPSWEGRNEVPVSEIIDGFAKHSGTATPSVNNVTDLIMDHPELRAAIPFERISEWSGEQLHGAQVFIASKDTGSPYHCANELNYFMMINGEKDWYIAHPRHSMWLDPVFDPRSGVYATAHFERDGDWDSPPAGIPLLHAHLKPGDVLLNLPWWWHLVSNRTDSVAVATRWRRWEFRVGTDNPLYSRMQWMVPHQWKILWTDYVRHGELTDTKWLKAFSAHHS